MTQPVATVIFDFDSTLIATESLEIILNHQLRDRPQDMSEIQRLTEQGMNGEIDFATSLNARLKVAAPSLKEINSFAEKSWQYLSLGMEQLIETLHQKSE